LDASGEPEVARFPAMQQPVDRQGFLRAGVGKQGYNYPAKAFLPALRAEFLALLAGKKKGCCSGL
jgi:hypothetical protein